MTIPRTVLQWSLVIVALVPPTAFFTIRSTPEAWSKALPQPRPNDLPDALTVSGTQRELLKLQTAVQDLRDKMRAGDVQVAQLQQRIKALEEKSTDSGSTAELRAQVTSAKAELDAAERENAVLSNKIAKFEEPKTRSAMGRSPARGDPGVRGRVLAVNRGYNFVVIDLGARHGVEINSEMLVLRRGSLIGKIRISSVEPATTIGDIITSSLARGVQVQTGDTIVYAGTN